VNTQKILVDLVEDLNRSMEPFREGNHTISNILWSLSKTALNILFVFIAVFGPEKAAAC
jgi:hypothetical protein